ncbi:hypothetical protein Pan153_48150 [Gimesia panareensis]|uniref:DUF1501 domain-containing protein n=1 Tax=Gimesia panareensis TaxID=2527978 RepID=A0A518FUY8_9PLAN|nr:hypothetical protein Pan153_48150 [Gimesia panareensis]
MSVPQRMTGCSDFRKLPRREFLKAGGLGLTGLTLAELLRHEAHAGPTARKEHSVIILWMRGGPSQHETWDPKPLAPADYRGAFGAIKTSVPGIEIVDLMPRCAKIMDKWSIIRSLHHTNAGHSAGDQILFTGYPPGTDPTTNVHPSCGAIVSEQLGHLTPELPPYVMIPRQVPGTDSAYRVWLINPLKPLPIPPMRDHSPYKTFPWWKASATIALPAARICSSVSISSAPTWIVPASWTRSASFSSRRSAS